MAKTLTEDSVLLTSTIEPVHIASTEKRISQTNTQHYKLKIVWKNVLIFIFLHIGAIYALWHVIVSTKWKIFLYSNYYANLASMGITAGAHRLWAHRGYEAKLPLRIFLMLAQTASLQNPIYIWARDHRVHHKYTDTDADPHNSVRGFFFSHMGWLMVKKHQDVAVKGKTIDISDLEADPVVMFQKRYYLLLAPLFCFLIPAIFPWYYWGEAWWRSILIAGVMRYIITLHFTWLVNSAAHIFGSKPYDKTISSAENRFVAWATNGEGWHNYHHVFPWDYKAAELGNYRLNLTTAFLNFMAKIGWAYNLKTVSPYLIKKRAERTGDGSWGKDKTKKEEHDVGHHHPDDTLWGWGDKDMTEEDKDHIRIYNNVKKM